MIQDKIEKQVTKYTRENFTFACFPVETNAERSRLELGIIATLSKDKSFLASPSWRGKYSSEYEIVQSGMWLKEGLNDVPLSESEYEKIEQYYSSVDMLWQSIIQKLSQSPHEIQTISQDGKKGKWICVSADNNSIFVDKAKYNTPSSSITFVRTINKNEFIKLYPLFYQWKKRNITRDEAKGDSMNSSYIFALINNFDDLPLLTK